MLWHSEFSAQHNISDITPDLNTVEPDIVHELFGHSPMFLDKDLADMSQEIGIQSLGASDDQVIKLGAIYWCAPSNNHNV
jgi:phenylalanine-4-hydroxylase